MRRSPPRTTRSSRRFLHIGDVGAEDLKAITADDFQVILDEALAAEDDAILA